MNFKMSFGVGLVSVLSVCFETCFAASESKSSKQTTEAAKRDSMINWAALDVMDCLRSGAMIVGFLALIVNDYNASKEGRSSRSRRPNYFVNAEIIISFVGGMAMFFFPTNILSYMSSTKLDNLHVVEMQFFGAVLVGSAITIAKCQHAIETDGLAYSSWLMTRSLGSGSVFLYSLQAHFSNNFNIQHLSSRVLGAGLFFLACVYLLLRGSSVGGSGSTKTSSTTGINRYIIFDVVFILPQIICYLAEPAASYKMYTDMPTDFYHWHLLQSISIIAIMCFMFMMCMIHSDDDAVKRDMFLGRIVMTLMMVVVSALYQWKSPVMTRCGFCLCMVISGLQLVYFTLAYTNGNWSQKQKSR